MIDQLKNTLEKVHGMMAVAFVLAVCLMAMPMNSTARQLDDVVLPDTVQLDGTDVELKLNGMGYREKFVFNVYVGALYTTTKVNSRDAVQALPGPKRITMHMVYDEVPSEKMAAAWNEGFEDNNSEEDFTKLSERLKTFISYFPDLKSGDVVHLDYRPASGTTVSINDVAKGEIVGQDFYRALLDVWLGDEPADEDLKDAMLGDSDD